MRMSCTPSALKKLEWMNNSYEQYLRHRLNGSVINPRLSRSPQGLNSWREVNFSKPHLNFSPSLVVTRVKTTVFCSLLSLHLHAPCPPGYDHFVHQVVSIYFFQLNTTFFLKKRAWTICLSLLVTADWNRSQHLTQSRPTPSVSQDWELQHTLDWSLEGKTSWGAGDQPMCGQRSRKCWPAERKREEVQTLKQKWETEREGSQVPECSIYGGSPSLRPGCIL